MIRIGIMGYGNIGKGIEANIKYFPDMKLVAIFTRRNPKSIIKKTNTSIVSVEEILNYKNKIDVLVLCGGSATDLPIQSVLYAKDFNIVDSFDTHANIPTHFNKINNQALENNNTAIISVGWDPGMFSLNRIYDEAILPNGNTYTFWGKGISQGHSDAIRIIPGVIDAKQYTIPVKSSIDKVLSGKSPILITKDKHSRDCFVVIDEKADKNLIEKTIKEMPNYFNEYNTTVNFITQEELNTNHSKMPHGGLVIRTGKTNNITHTISYQLKLDSNPEFTSSVLLAYARACYRLNNEKNYGCKTVIDIAPKYLSFKTNEELRKEML